MDGKSYLLELALRADFALVQAFLADDLDNLSYALTARNFNPVIPMAADTVIVVPSTSYRSASSLLTTSSHPPPSSITSLPMREMTMDAQTISPIGLPASSRRA